MQTSLFVTHEPNSKILLNPHASSVCLHFTICNVTQSYVQKMLHNLQINSIKVCLRSSSGRNAQRSLARFGVEPGHVPLSDAAGDFSSLACGENVVWNVINRQFLVNLLEFHQSASSLNHNKSKNKHSLTSS